MKKDKEIQLNLIYINTMFLNFGNMKMCGLQLAVSQKLLCASHDIVTNTTPGQLRNMHNTILYKSPYHLFSRSTPYTIK